jgi:beta-glucanase (GH16 family)
MYLPVLVTLLVASASAQTYTNLVWSDEFETDGAPDSSKWTYDIGTGSNGWGNNELEYYTDRLVNAQVLDGNLIIQALVEDYDGSSYTSARLVSRGLGYWTHARVEVSAKIPGGVGTWPAIWMLPEDNVYGDWPNSGEIDIMEMVGFDDNNIHETVHCQNYNGEIGNEPTSVTYVSNAMTDFNVYAMEWDASQIRMYVNDVMYFSWDKLSDSSADWPFDQSFYVLLNIAVGGSWGGQDGVDDSSFPASLIVDYVRVYQ